MPLGVISLDATEFAALSAGVMAGIMTVERIRKLIEANDGNGDIVLRVRNYSWIGNIDVHSTADLSPHPERKRNLQPG